MYAMSQLSQHHKRSTRESTINPEEAATPLQPVIVCCACVEVPQVNLYHGA